MLICNTSTSSVRHDGIFNVKIMFITIYLKSYIGHVIYIIMWQGAMHRHGDKLQNSNK